MIARRVVWPWSEVIGSWYPIPKPRTVDKTNVFDEVFGALAEGFGCMVALIGRVYLGEHGEWSIRPVVLWSADPDAEYAFPPSVAADQGIRALVEGQIDAIVYADTSRARGELADLFRAAGATSLVIIPLDLGAGRGLIVAVGLHCEREDLPDKVSDLLSVLVPRDSLTPYAMTTASKGG